MGHSARTRQARRNGYQSAAAETVSHELAGQFGKLLGVYVDPTSFVFNIALGHWAHDYADVQRFDGHFRAGDRSYTLGSWDHTLSKLARAGCHIIDTRGNRLADNDFLIEKGRRSDVDDSNDWYSLAQLEEIARKEAEGRS